MITPSGPAKIGERLASARPQNDEAAERFAIEAEGETSSLAPPSDVRLFSAVDLAAPLPPFQWVSKAFGLIHGRVLALSGFGDAGKTFAGMDLLLAVAAGGVAMGSVKVDIEGPVLHIDYEQQYHVTAMRYQRLAKGRGIDLASLGDRLQYASGTEGKGRAPLLTVENAERWLTRVCAGKSVVLVDNFSASTGGGLDMNKSSSAEIPYMLGRVSAATGAALLLVIHETKPSGDRDSSRTKGQKMMGSAQIHGALGGGLGFTRVDSGAIMVEQTKATMGQAPEPAYFRLVDEGPTDASTRCSESLRLEWVPAEEQAEESEKAKRVKAAPPRGMVRDVLAFLMKHGPCSGNHVRLGVDGTNAVKDAALRQLIDEGHVTSNPGARGAVLFSVV